MSRWRDKGDISACSVQKLLTPSLLIIDEFESCTQKCFERQLKHTQSKYCNLDPISIGVLQQFLQDLVMYITDRRNTLLRQECLLMSQTYDVSNRYAWYV